MRADDTDTPAPAEPGMQANGEETRALEALLRDEHAVVVGAVALACGATTFQDRAQLARIGGEMVVLCCALRERLTMSGGAVPSGANRDIISALLATASYDARLSALADVLDTTAAHATTELAESVDGEYLRTLRDLIAAHAQSAEWLRERAAAFAGTRPHDEAQQGTDEPEGDAGEAARRGEPAPDS